jgi:hypothetical protein
VSAVALIVESEADTAAPVEGEGPLEISADAGIELEPGEHTEDVLEEEPPDPADA